MNNDSGRVNNSIRNSLYSVISYTITIIFSFITRTVFIKTLGAEFLGINGLFSGVLSMLSFAELGLGTAIVYAMYKPLALNDRKNISALMNLYRKAYTTIGGVIFIVGLGITPFLEYLIKDYPDLSNLKLYFVLFLTNSSISYFYAHKRSIIIASQKAYIDSKNRMVFMVIQNIFQILVLILYNNYLLYLLIQILSTLISNISISKKADLMFPYLEKYKKETLSKEERKSIGKNVLAMISHKTGSVIVSGTDNILIASFVGIYWLGLYSNYTLILNVVKSLILQLINPVTASIGNLNAIEDEERSYDIFKKMLFFNFSISLISSLLLLNIYNPFIKFWIGGEYLLSLDIVFLIVIDFFVIQMRKTAIIFIDTYGLFWEIKLKSLVEAIVNLCVSLVLLVILDLGIYGVLMGTLISNIVTNIWWEPYVVYKYKFKRSIVEYFSIYFKYFIFTAFVALITIYINSYFSYEGLIGIVVIGFSTLVIGICSLFLAFHHTNEWSYLYNIIKNNIKKAI